MQDAAWEATRGCSMGGNEHGSMGGNEQPGSRRPQAFSTMNNKHACVVASIVVKQLERAVGPVRFDNNHNECAFEAAANVTSSLRGSWTSSARTITIITNAPTGQQLRSRAA